MKNRKVKQALLAVLLASLLANSLPVSANADAEEQESMSYSDSFENGVSGNGISINESDPSFKRVTVPVPKEYKTCLFKVTCENEGDYSVTILSPKGKEFKASQNTKFLSTCTIEKVMAGDWIVRVISNTGTPIGKVKVDIQAVTSSTQVIDEVPIAKDINGLEIYFKDDSIVAEWKDMSVGAVHASVYNTKNQMLLADEKIPDGTNYFEAELPADVEQVTISLVPTASEEFDEAETIRTYLVNNNPNATVKFPTERFTNQDHISITAELNDSYGIEIYNNENLQQEIPAKSAGEYSYEVSLTGGSNIVKVYIVDADGNKRSFQTEVIKDTTPPTLVLSESYTDVTTEDDTLTITGNVRDCESVSVDGYDVEVRENGDFTYDVPLFAGQNGIDVIAKDQAGNETKYTANVTRVEKKKGGLSSTSAPLLIMTAVFGAILFALYKLGFLNIPQKNSKVEGEQSKKELHGMAEGKQKEHSPSVQKKKKVIPTDKKMKEEKTAEKKKKEKPVKKRDGKNKKGFNVELIYYACLPAVAYIFVNFVVMIATVPSGSMIPTVNIEDCVIANRLAYLAREPERGDIVIFKDAGRTNRPDDQFLIKRIIGMPGDTVSFKDGDIYVDDVKCVEDYLSYDTETNTLQRDETFEVPEGSYFVLGDNRNDSVDSRYWDDPYVKREELRGKYLYSFHMPAPLYKLIQFKDSPESAVVSDSAAQESRVATTETVPTSER